MLPTLVAPGHLYTGRSGFFVRPMPESRAPGSAGQDVANLAKVRGGVHGPEFSEFRNAGTMAVVRAVCARMFSCHGRRDRDNGDHAAATPFADSCVSNGDSWRMVSRNVGSRRLRSHGCGARQLAFRPIRAFLLRGERHAAD